MIASVLEGFVVVEFVQSFPALHERELPAEADLLFCIGTTVEGARRPVQQKVITFNLKYFQLDLTTNKLQFDCDVR